MEGRKEARAGFLGWQDVGRETIERLSYLELRRIKLEMLASHLTGTLLDLPKPQLVVTLSRKNPPDIFHNLRFVPGVTRKRKKERIVERISSSIDKRLSFTFYVPSTITTTNLFFLAKIPSLWTHNGTESKKSINRKVIKCDGIPRKTNLLRARSVACSQFDRISCGRGDGALHCIAYDKSNMIAVYISVCAPI